MNDEVTRRSLPDEVANLLIAMEEEITSVISPCELIPVSEGELEVEDELEILESWPIEGESNGTDRG
jgi:hypothetical protein